MCGHHIITLMLLVWSFVGGGICKQNVKGVLHGRVELHTCHELQQNVKSVEWFKHRNSTSQRLLYRFEQPNDLTSYSPSQNIQFNEDNMSLIFVNLTKEDEGVYLNKIVPGSDSNKAVTKQCNITLSVLSPPSALRIAVATSNYTLTLRCEVRGEFLNLRWLRNGLLLPDDQRTSISENNMTVHVSNLKNSDRGTYTCQVSNLHGTSETHVNITENTTLCQDDKMITQPGPDEHQPTTQFLLYAGIAVIPILLVCILIYICTKGYCRRDPRNRGKGHRKTNDIAMEEPIYDEPNCPQVQVQESSFDEKPDASIVNPLPYVYTDFIKPKAQLTEKQQDEEAGYSTIAEMQAHEASSKPTRVNKAANLSECLLLSNNS